MRELLETVAAWQAEGVGFGRAVLIRAFGSAPRLPGATLLVADDGRIAGSVSGGCVEAACADEVRAARDRGEVRVVRYAISDSRAWEVGLACGSTIDVLIEPALQPALLTAAEQPPAAVLTDLPVGAPGKNDGPAPPAAGPAGASRLVRPGGQDDGTAAAISAALELGRSAVVERPDGSQVFVEGFAVAPRLVVFGAVDVARSLVRLAHELGFRVLVVDARAAFLTRERFPDADALLLGWPDELADRLALAAADSVAVLTHDPKLDDPAIALAMRAGCGYVGAIGSRRTQAARRERLTAAGVTEAELARLRGPIGLDLGGREPAETALAILAEVVATRYSAHGRPLANE
ncbi:MAG TPA: XdhC/CoxI family protein [Candidatus Limnocylindrales bacterium]